MKICIIGAGSTYTPELIEGLINKRVTLPVSELYLMDIDERKLTIVGGLAKRMVEHAELPCKVVLTMDYEEALTGADFVLAQIRVGKLPARQKDERIPLKYGLIGQETCGMGGMFKAFRTVPAMLKIVSIMEKCCPNAWLNKGHQEEKVEIILSKPPYSRTSNRSKAQSALPYESERTVSPIPRMADKPFPLFGRGIGGTPLCQLRPHLHGQLLPDMRTGCGCGPYHLALSMEEHPERMGHGL